MPANIRETYELAESCRYPVAAFEGGFLTWANAGARIFLGKYLEAKTLDGLLGGKNAADIQKAAETRGEWHGAVDIDGMTAAASLVFINGLPFVAVRPGTAPPGDSFMPDRMLSDMGQMMKEPLSGLYAALQQLEEYIPEKLKPSLGLARRSFYALSCLSEKQIALAPPSALDAHNNLRLMPVRETLEMITSAANEALGDKRITVEIEDGAAEAYCRLYEKKLVQLMMMLYSSAVRDLRDGETVNVSCNISANKVFIGVPVRRGMLSLFSFAEYAEAAGTAMACEPLENRMFEMIVRSFNSIHGSTILPSESNGRSFIMISLDTDGSSGADVGEPPVFPERLYGGLRPDLMYLSDILGSESYV